MQSVASDSIPKPTSAKSSRQAALENRLIALILFCVTAGVMGIAYMLHPDVRGVGTHESLGLPPCGLEAATGIPCATCGMTTSFSYAAHGDFVNAFINQPAGALLALLTTMTALVSGYAFITGMRLGPIGNIVWRPKNVVIGAVILVLAWIYKIIVHTGILGAGL